MGIDQRSDQGDISATVRGNEDGGRVLLTDGTGVVMRRLRPGDREAVRALYAEMPLDDRYLRFFTAAPADPARVAAAMLDRGGVAIGAFRGRDLIGVGNYSSAAQGEDPELAVAVSHAEQHKGIASLLLEHLVAAAAAAGIRRLTADVLLINHEMLRVIADSGYRVSRARVGDVVHVVLHLPRGADEDYVGAVVEREATADVPSLQPLLAPRSVVVVGAGRRPGSVGRIVLRSIVSGGFTGSVFAVNPGASVIGGVPCHRSVSELPEGIDLAVLCVPAQAVPEAADECGRRGIRALLVLTAGVTRDRELAGGLAAALIRHGMRMAGPNCLGLSNTDPAVRLQATFGPQVTTGEVGVAAQSGGVAIALTTELDRIGLGTTTVLSTGDATDVNGDDMLLWWAADGRTRAAVLYLESLPRPHQFARLARRLSRRMPIVAIRSGSSAAAQAAAATHTAATATPRVFRDALLAQSGVLAVDELTTVPGLLAVLCRQPAPAGRRVAILSNAGGAGVLAAEACARSDLIVAHFTAVTCDALAGLLPSGAAVANPVDATATVSAATFGRAVDVLLGAPDVDAVIVLTVATAAGDPLLDLAAAGNAEKPVVAVRLGQAVRLAGPTAAGRTAGSPEAVPVYGEPGDAVRALAAAADRADWLRSSSAPAPPPSGVHAPQAETIVAEALATQPAGCWLTPPAAVELVRAAGVPVAATDVVDGVEAAVAGWRRIGGPVAVKADVQGVLHKSHVGGVRTGLDSADQVSRAVRDFRDRFGSELRGVVVQPMIEPGPEL
ncbi:MAG TPA: GNAT family N-acetyltransferase, partial [Pseudonocardia sp.]